MPTQDPCPGRIPNGKPGWIRRHLAVCPRCQRRFAALGRVELALQLARCVPQRPDLLAQANRSALRVLRRPLRQGPDAEALRGARPEPTGWQRWSAWRSTISQAAACIALLLLARSGLHRGLQQAERCGRSALRSYYRQGLDPQASQDLFPH